AIDNLDLVIAVDTATAHVAGALGKPVWILVPFVPDWRWLIEREDTPYYPRARLFRQPARGDWDSVVLRVRGALDALTGGAPKPRGPCAKPGQSLTATRSRRPKRPSRPRSLPIRCTRAPGTA